MPNDLTDVEARIVGSLVEKQLTTPDHYPLTLNALAAACNQRSNRDPVVSFDETTILGAIDSLRDKNLVYLFYGSTSRSVKYKHMLPSVFELDVPSVAIVAVLLLRGAQTLGEIRERTGRLYEFSGLGDVSETLDRLAGRAVPIVVKLPPQPGQKEGRYAHLLSGSIDIDQMNLRNDRSPAAGPTAERLAKLEQGLEALSAEMAAIRKTLDEFRQQFE
ncbi:MAG: YceH family protein [Pyrinomonadaceae bacterium]